MKFIIAIIQPYKLDVVRNALQGVGVMGLTVSGDALRASGDSEGTGTEAGGSSEAVLASRGTELARRLTSGDVCNNTTR